VSETFSFLPGDVALPYGLAPDGTLVAVDKVLRGLKCDCVCPGCGRPLVAKKGEIIRGHFAHLADAHCSIGFESMVHLMAKEIIARERHITVPLVFVRAGLSEKHVRPAAFLQLTNVRLEKWLDGLRPDIIADHEGHDLIIEVAVTHKAEPEKIAELKRRGAPAIEIDLSAFHRKEISDETLTPSILSLAPRHWLFNRVAALAQIEVEGVEEARLQAERLKQVRRAAEQAMLMEEWARWEKDQIPVRAQEALARENRAKMNRQAFEAVGKTIYEAATKLLGRETAKEWTDKQITGAMDSGGVYRSGINFERVQRLILDRLLLEAEHVRDIQTSDRVSREALLRAAMARLGSRERAELWMNTVNPKIGRRRPIDVCTGPSGVEMCRAAL
jgi:hypothetical protein